MNVSDEWLGPETTTAETFDDALRDVLSAITTIGLPGRASRGPFREVVGAKIVILNPRARLSHTATRGRVFSCLGELVWYLSGSDRVEAIRPYIRAYEKEAEPDGTVLGAYGPRIFGRASHRPTLHDVVAILRDKPSSRRVFLPIYEPRDIDGARKEVPCTIGLQFLVRAGRLHVIASMRSNDAVKGFAHDVFAFTMIQELVARTLDMDVGSYVHDVGSLHLYESDGEVASSFLAEGFQPTRGMPPMPVGDPWAAIERIVELERTIREGGDVDPGATGLEPYWQAILSTLALHLRWNHGNDERELWRRALDGSFFEPYVVDRGERRRRERGK